MRYRMKQGGMTLVEMLIAMGISGVILAGLSAGIYAIMDVTGRGNDEIHTIRDIQSASYWISTDAQMARTIQLIDGDPGTGINLEWDDADDNPHSGNYTLSGSELLRNVDGNLSTVAWNVSTVEFSVTGSILTYNIVSAIPGRWNVTQNVTGQVNLRAYTVN